LPRASRATLTQLFFYRSHYDPGKPLDICFPWHIRNQFQQVKVLSRAAISRSRDHEPEYGNKMFYATRTKPLSPEYHFTLSTDVVRLSTCRRVTKETSIGKNLRRFLQADKLVPDTGKPAELAAAQVKAGHV